MDCEFRFLENAFVPGDELIRGANGRIDGAARLLHGTWMSVRGIGAERRRQIIVWVGELVWVCRSHCHSAREDSFPR